MSKKNHGRDQSTSSVKRCMIGPLVCMSPETEQLTGSSPDTARCAGDEDVLVEESVGGEDGAHDVGCRWWYVIG